MSYKQIVFTAPGVAEIKKYEIGDPKEDEVQVRLAVSTLSSGTERANLIGNPNISPHSPGVKVEYPRILGYSSSGIVEKVGSEVTSLRPGDRVAMCWSTHSQVINIKEEWAIKLHDNVSFEDGALINIGTFPLAAIRKCGIEFGESSLVVGLGILGMASLMLLKAVGAAPIIASCTSSKKLIKAKKLGADFALNAKDPDFSNAVKSITGDGAITAIEVTGSGEALNTALDCMAKFGRVALLGCTRESNFTIDYYRKVHGPGITLIGAHTDARPRLESRPGWWTTRDDMLSLEKAMALNRFHLSDVIDEIHPVEDAPSVYRRLLTDKDFPLTQFDWRE